MRKLLGLDGSDDDSDPQEHNGEVPVLMMMMTHFLEVEMTLTLTTMVLENQKPLHLFQESIASKKRSVQN